MDTAPVTYMQQSDMDGRSRVWLSFDLRGPLDIDALLAALASVVARHDALRLRLLPDRDGEPRQYAVPAADEPPAIELQQVECDSEAEFLDHVEAQLVEELDSEWNLADEPPARFVLCRFTPTHHALCAVFVRFAVDGRGHRQFAAELWTAYADLQAGETPSTEPAPGFLPAANKSMSQYRKRAAKNVAYWRNALAPDPAFAAMAERQRQADEAGACVRYFFVTSAERTRLAEEAARSRCTEFEVLLALTAEVVADVLSLPRLIVVALNDFRAVDDREVLGAFARGVPIVLDRATTDPPLISPHQVQRSVLRGRVHGCVSPDAMADCYRELERAHGLLVPSSFYFSYVDHTAIADQPSRLGDLAIGRGPGLSNAALYAPMLDVVADGLADGIHLRAVINTGVFRDDDFDRLVDGLTAALAAQAVPSSQRS